MKVTRLLLAMALLAAFSFQSFAQDRDDDDDDRRRKRRFGTYNDFRIDLGINNWLEDGESPSNNNELYSVRPFGSWYIAFKSVNDTHIGGPLHLLWGPDISWYNFKFENEAVRIQEGTDGLVFSEATNDVEFVKSKLTAAYVNFSAVPMLQFGGRRRHHHRWDDFHFGGSHEGGFRIGLGAYAGYRIASYTKTVVRDGSDKDKNRAKDGFFMENFRYGARLQAGFRDVDLFFNYDLNEVFAEGRGPALNAFSFGVIL